MDLSTALFWLTLTVYKESRNLEPLDQLAVAHVILNRSRRSGDSIKVTVLKPYQFSCYNSGVVIPDDKKGLELVRNNIEVSLAGHDFTRGAEFYHHVSISPYWADAYEKVGEFGSHVFYRR